MDYNKITLEECFVYYYTGKVACECNADEKDIKPYIEECNRLTKEFNKLKEEN